MKIAQQIALEQSSFVPPIVKDYLNKDAQLSPFVTSWHNTQGMENAIQNRVFDRVKREVLVKHLHEQYEGAEVFLESGELVQTNIRHLLELQTYTITTGHQLSLFGGTLFMTYKILSAIKLAQNLSQQFPQKKFVPVLWLASEDHDFEEIQTTHLFGKDITWGTDSGAKLTGKISLEDISQTLQELGELMGEKEQAKIWFSQIKLAYESHRNLGEASIRFYHNLFKSFGLVILDPNAKALKRFLLPIMEADILKQETYAVQQVSDKVLDAKYKLQIHARPINFFYVNEQFVRSMIKRNEEGNFSLASGEKEWTSSEMADEIAHFPERFSPNVNLRPVFQEIILPNLSYFGGPAEVAYWLQLKPIFDYYEISYPLVGLRYMNIFVPSNMQERVIKMGLVIEDLLLSESQLTQKFVQQVQGISFPEKMETILNSLQDLVDHAKVLDVNLGKEMLAFKLQSKDFFKSKTPALKKAAEMSQEAQIEKLLKLRGRLFPKGILQERIETLLQHEITMNTSILTEILNQMEVFSGKMDLTIN